MSLYTKHFIKIGVLVGLLAGCGGDYFDVYLRSGEEITLGQVKRISSSGDLSSTSCQTLDGTETYDCIESTSIYVGLPSALAYAGDPEVVYGFGDFLFGESNLSEPVLTSCHNLGIALRFKAPEDRLDNNSEYQGIVAEVGDDVLDDSVREFRFDVRGESTSSNVPIYVRSVPKGVTLTCAQIFSGSPEFVVKVVSSEK